MVHDAEAFTQRGGEHSRSRRRADQREALERQFYRLGVRAAIDDEIDLVILHRRIQELFDHSAQTMYLVDEQDVAFFQRGQDTNQIFRLLERRAAGRPQRASQILGDKRCERRLAQAWRPIKQDVLEWFASTPGSIDGDLQIFDDGILPDVLVERPRPQARTIDLIFERIFCTDDPVIGVILTLRYLRAGLRRRTASLSRGNVLRPIQFLTRVVRHALAPFGDRFRRAVLRRRESAEMRPGSNESFLPLRRAYIPTAAIPRAPRRQNPASGPR